METGFKIYIFHFKYYNTRGLNLLKTLQILIFCYDSSEPELGGWGHLCTCAQCTLNILLLMTNCWLRLLRPFIIEIQFLNFKQ